MMDPKDKLADAAALDDNALENVVGGTDPFPPPDPDDLIPLDPDDLFPDDDPFSHLPLKPFVPLFPAYDDTVGIDFIDPTPLKKFAETIEENKY